MDNQNLPPILKPSTVYRSSTQIIFVLLGIIVLAEIIWAASTLLKKPESVRLDNKTSIASKRKSPTISLQASKQEIKIGDKVILTINLDSDIYSDGTDVVINYDPKLLRISKDTSPVDIGVVYKSFPQNKVDTTLGRIAVSGVTDKKEGILAEGVFGTVEFTAKAPGKADIGIDFKPSNTTDSNIIKTGTGQDVLEKVENTQINILP